MTEVIGKGSWEELVTRHLYQPLGMNNSTFAKEMNNDPTFAQPIEHYLGELRNINPQLPR
jgi:CubicO group peptidase (beta-lactamase class C family)